VWESIKR
jgi:hypothetical protein